MRSGGDTAGPGRPASGDQAKEQERNPGPGPKGKLYVVGLGPGEPLGLTEQARLALEEADAVLGYGTYVDMVRPLLEGKEVLASGMTRELDRADKALELAKAGRVVALVSGGDAGIYGMSPVVFELMQAQGIEPGPAGVEVEVIPGVPAVAAAAALLGAPLSHDFACISLSDRLTPWELIEKRLDLASQADLVIALYNPKSKSRAWQFDKALTILARHREPKTPVGVVGRAMRPGQSVTLTTLERVAKAEVDMQTVVLVGNSQTFTHAGRMVTPRGYARKYLEPKEAK